MAKWVYAVAKGHQTGVYSSWEECRSQVNGYNGAVFRKFATELEAKAFIDQHHDSNHQSRSQGGGEAEATSISALRIKKEMDSRSGGGSSWHCIVGQDFGSYVTHEAKHFIYFYVNKLGVLLFKSG